MSIDKDQISALRDRWNEQHDREQRRRHADPDKRVEADAIPSISNWRDAQLAEMLKLTDQDIAMAFRCPPQIVGLETSGGAGSTEALMQSWISPGGLGFCLNHIEEAIGHTFDLDGQPDEYVEFDTKALLRSNFKERIEGLARGVQGGIYSPNEARNAEDLDSVTFGDEPRVQQQVVPLSAADKIPASPAPPQRRRHQYQNRRTQQGTEDAKRYALARSLLNRSRQLEWQQQRRIA